MIRCPACEAVNYAGEELCEACGADLRAIDVPQDAADFSGRDALGELAASSPRTSHHLPGEEIPEDFWFYRFLKKQLFFGMGAYG